MSDPTAEFLAREQAEFDSFDAPAPASGDVPAADFGTDEGFAAFDNGDATAAALSAVNAASQEAWSSDAAFGDSSSSAFGAPAETEQQQQQQQTSEPHSNDRYAAVGAVDAAMGEGEAIRAWRAEREQRLSEKDAQEKAAKDSLLAKGKKDLQDWQTRYDEQLVKSKKNNREAEAVFIRERDEAGSGNEWERVSKLVDFNPKSAKGTKDTARMRTIFLQLKQSPLVR
ncbi:clathrin light chain [Capsaspora owczarzaki ATCC 30864]|uniref:Clathrin light chain n=1 Tax=Capsaspora owczarzaki (strain ATCC 30864) TaxID=595528 RepID=A0A0D2WPV4_CAPO3|nr:clathrin light chain [Capsaspora owczarzaki ATCC 30864]KJE93530.1 clathrin light chain [Capsaspora owczarzaki ATCC 30864]|eukprot:XP_004348131.1 clathrin light chain [Capsaspora owczarzaki ATCC 30864]